MKTCKSVEVGRLSFMEVGTFEVTSGKMIVSDPCYNMGVWCTGTLNDVKNGTYHAYILRGEDGEWGVRNHALMVMHESSVLSSLEETFNHYQQKNTEMVEADFVVGVDSGQAGFYDYPIFEKKEYVPNPDIALDQFFDKDGERWYGTCCALTCGNMEEHHYQGVHGISAGVIAGGVVSSSGCGDGSYICRYKKDSDGKVIVAEIEFIGEEDDCDEE